MNETVRSQERRHEEVRALLRGRKPTVDADPADMFLVGLLKEHAQGDERIREAWPEHDWFHLIGREYRNATVRRARSAPGAARDSSSSRE